MPFLLAICLILAFAAVARPASAHPGGVNADGCHTNRKTGDYHCHGARKAAPRSLPSRAQRMISGGSDYYPNCAAVRAAGAAPLRRGSPGYRAGLDRDGDGVACE